MFGAFRLLVCALVQLASSVVYKSISKMSLSRGLLRCRPLLMSLEQLSRQHRPVCSDRAEGRTSAPRMVTCSWNYPTSSVQDGNQRMLHTSTVILLISTIYPSISFHGASIRWRGNAVMFVMIPFCSISILLAWYFFLLHHFFHFRATIC